MNLTSLAEVDALLRRHGFQTRQRLGQNFLIDRNTLLKVVTAADLEPEDAVVEVGPGIGTLTVELAARAGRLTAVEVDPRLLPILQEVLAGYPNAEVVHADFLRLRLESFFAERCSGRRCKVVANLPYYITSPVLTALLEHHAMLERIVLMVQKEVADRLTAAPGTEAYGSLSVFAQWRARVETVARVSRHVFRPPPNVDSAIVRLLLREAPPAAVNDEGRFFDVVHAAFQKRRKTLLNALATFPTLGLTKEAAAEALRRASIDPARRGETLAITEFAALANALPAGELTEIAKARKARKREDKRE
jgi:16S rRNA (adenine1518-N6/adenine1519-N6)-dimethyltransferase